MAWAAAHIVLERVNVILDFDQLHEAHETEDTQHAKRDQPVRVDV